MSNEETNVHQLMTITSALRQNMGEVFNIDEIQLLCTDLGIDYEELSGNTKSRKLDELLGHIQRRGRLSDLIAILNHKRPHINWSILSQENHEASDESVSTLEFNDLSESADPSVAEDDYSLVEQITFLQSQTTSLCQQFNLHSSLLPIVETLTTEIKQLLKIINQFIKDNPDNPMKRALEESLERVNNQCEDVKHKLRFALLQANKEPLGNFTQPPRNSLESLAKSLANLSSLTARSQII